MSEESNGDETEPEAEDEADQEQSADLEAIRTRLEALNDDLEGLQSDLEAAETEDDLDVVEADIEEFRADLEEIEIPEPPEEEDEDEDDEESEPAPEEQLQETYDEIESDVSDLEDDLEDKRGPYAEDVIGEIDGVSGTITGTRWAEEGDEELIDATEAFLADLNDLLGTSVTLPSNLEPASGAELGENGEEEKTVPDELALLEFADHLVDARRAHLEEIRERPRRRRSVFHPLCEVNRLEILICGVHRVPPLPLVLSVVGARVETDVDAAPAAAISVAPIMLCAP
ncbi:hypothetical protein ATJ93_0506 [Halopiger aswanensis]|uniref:Uncharacterized protein n=1 Tax=Halopiger aswanensis TaxID=148449 RepID=A0A419WQ35_9EURY|nr:hypothetical protein ATJ93_0506 [Halopiger aswanensis]